MTAKKRTDGRGSGVVLADRYRLEEQVAAGGMGEVWRATDTLLQRNVAVKLLRESLAGDPVVAQRFRREAMLAAQLSHPNMAGVFDYVEEHDRPGIVMEFVDGETLAERLAREGRLSVVESARITSALLSALQAAHDAGIVHRDVKPGNVMLTSNGGVKVTDFGIARAASDHTLTETGMIVGTAHYVAPEQVSGKPATPSSDLYSVGAIVYEMLAGRRLFEADTPIAVAMRRLAEDPEPLREVRPDVPEELSAVVMRALARDPSKRWPSARDMRRALDTAVAWSQPATVPQRIDPTPTQVLEVAEPDPAAATIVTRREQDAPTGSAPAVAVSRRRRREYRRLAIFGALVALVAGLATAVILLLAGSGPDVVQVPNFTGRTIEQARKLAADQGLHLSEVSRPGAQPAGTVIGQSIPAGTPVATGATVTLGVSNGTPPALPEVPVPDVVGNDQQEATDVLKAAGFKVKVSEATTTAFDPGVVIGQTPASTMTAEPGSEVVIVVAKAPKGRGKHGGGD